MFLSAVTKVVAKELMMRKRFSLNEDEDKGCRGYRKGDFDFFCLEVNFKSLILMEMTLIAGVFFIECSHSALRDHRS